MKKIKIQLAVTAIIVAMFSSCTDNNTSPTGDDRDSFAGSWTCNEVSKQYGNATYPVTITKYGDYDSVTIKNFYQLGNSISALALVSGSSITIPYQDVSGGIKVTGTGILSNSKINLTYYATDAGVKDTITATYTK